MDRIHCRFAVWLIATFCLPDRIWLAATTMRTLPKTDWIVYKTVIAIDGQDYDVAADVFLECRNIPDPHSVTGKEEKVTASVEGWNSLPPMDNEQHPSYWKLDSAIREEVEEEYST